MEILGIPIDFFLYFLTTGLVIIIGIYKIFTHDGHSKQFKESYTETHKVNIYEVTYVINLVSGDFIYTKVILDEIDGVLSSSFIDKFSVWEKLTIDNHTISTKHVVKISEVSKKLLRKEVQVISKDKYQNIIDVKVISSEEIK